MFRKDIICNFIDQFNDDQIIVFINMFVYFLWNGCFVFVVFSVYFYICFFFLVKNCVKNKCNNSNDGSGYIKFSSKCSKLNWRS